MNGELQFRRMVRSDLDEVMRIEAGSHPDAWKRKTFWHWLSAPEARGELLLVEGRVVGFALWTLEPRALHLLNLAVAAPERRRGYGRALLERAHRAARDAGRSCIVLEVRESNLAGQLLYKVRGYVLTEILKRHYGDEDGYRMECDLHAE